MPALTVRLLSSARAAIAALPLVLAALAGATAFVAVSTTDAEAQRSDYRDSRRNDRDVAGKFDYYALVLSWSPSYCADRRSKSFDPQCDHNRTRPYAFVLHGLWPQHTRGYPERCWTRDRPFVPRKLINQMLDIMPSSKLVIHEYKKHGTCSGFGPEGYYRLSRRLYESVKIPEKFVEPAKPFMISPEAVVDEFVKANPKMRADMMGVMCRGAGNRLREIRICFSKDGKFKPCGQNENQRRLCSARRMFVPPVRISRGK